MLAMLFATYIIRGKWKYEDVPELIKADVNKILKAEGYTDFS
ncbi:CD1375 family protein [Bacillus sp. CH30_1T]|nr:CD1375 family protein [Bacillus sp. CH30_1T]